MKFKDLVNKIQEKNELGKPETTKNYASNTPGQPPVTFTPDTKYDGVALAKELDPSGGIMKQVAKATTNMDIDADGDVDAIDKKNDTIPDEVSGSEKKNKTLALLKKGAAERAHTKKGVAYESIDLKKAKMGDVIKDFQKSDAPQFKGKSDEKKREMAIAAKLSADDTQKEGVNSADKKPETYVAPDGKTKTRMVPTDKEVVKEGDLEETRVLGRITSDEVHKVLGPTKNAAQGIEALKKAFKVTDAQAKMMMDKVMKESVELDEASTYNKTSPAHQAAKKTVKGMGGHAKAEYHPDGSATVHTKTHGSISSTRTVDHHHNTHGLGYNRSEHDYKNSSHSANGLTHKTTGSNATGHKIHISASKPQHESVEHIEEAEDKSLSRLKQLVRFGLMDKSKLPILSRAMKSLEKGQVTNPSERSTLFELLNELIGLVTGDDAMFAKVRMNVQNEEVELEEAKASDYQIHHKTYSSAVQHAVDHTNKHSGFTVDQDHYDRAVAMGPRKPSEGKTNTFSLTLHDKNGKESKKKLHMQVYGMGDGKYELNKYVS